MPLGLQGAPSSFQDLMDEVMKDVRGFCIVYLDDIIVFTKSGVNHLEKVGAPSLGYTC